MRKPCVPLLLIHEQPPKAAPAFRAASCPPEDQITVGLNLENLIMDNARRRKEWERLQEGLPNQAATSRCGDRRLATFMTLKMDPAPLIRLSRAFRGLPQAAETHTTRPTDVAGAPLR